MDLTPSFMTSVDGRGEGLVSNLDYFENRRRNFIRKKYGRKRCLPHLHVPFSSGAEILWAEIFLFAPLMRINKQRSLKAI